MSFVVSVILPTHAPDLGRISRTLDGLHKQTWPLEHWELVVVDNASPDPKIFSCLDLSWHPSARVVCESRLGLTYARLAGMAESSGELLVLVDDDNVLAPDYLAETIAAFDRDPHLGAIGGKSLPEWETCPPDWVQEFASCLALRDLGNQERVAGFDESGNYPLFAPIGAGMVLRRAVAEEYTRVVRRSDRTTLTDRRGKQLTSGGDNNIVLNALAAGWKVAYCPQLSLTHLIPAARVTTDYLARLNHGIARSWVQVLSIHGIRPWKPIARWTLLPRKLRAFWRYRAWRDAASYVRWRGACGIFEGQSILSSEEHK